MLFLRANLLVLSVCSGQRPLKIRMPSVLPPGILIWLGMSATSIEVSEPGTLHATLHAACCACSACSAPHLRRFGVTEHERLFTKEYRAGPMIVTTFCRQQNATAHRRMSGGAHTTL